MDHNSPKPKRERTEYRASYYAAHSEKIKEASAMWRANNREKKRAYNVRYRAANLELLKAKDAKYRSENQEKIRLKSARYYAQNSERVKESVGKYKTTRCAVDPLFRLRHYTRILIANSLKRSGFHKKSRTADILGCTPTFFKAYIEQRFLPGMSWENRNLWHIDHIMPVASAKTEKELIKLNHYTNLRPLWAADNIRKRDSVPEQLTLMAA